MLRSVLVVCVGNICRSPLAERLLAARVPGLTVSSAGIAALVGHPSDESTNLVATAHGLSLAGHQARQFTPEMGARADLILVMEQGHRKAILMQSPQLSGRVMLFDHWTGARGIADPYRQDLAFHQNIFSELAAAADAWAARLARKE